MSKEKKNKVMGYRQKWERKEKERKRKEIRLCIMRMPARVAK